MGINRIMTAGSLVAGVLLAGIVQAAPARQFELGAEAGQAEQKYSLDGPIDDKSGDEMGYRLFGTWFPAETFGVRGAFADFGNTEVYSYSLGVADYTVESDVTAYTLGAVLTTPVSQGPVQFWGEFGLAFWDLDLNQKVSVPSLAVAVSDELDSDTDTAPYAGVGLLLELGSGFGVGVSAFWYKMEPEYQGEEVDLDIRVLSAGASLRF